MIIRRYLIFILLWMLCLSAVAQDESLNELLGEYVADEDLSVVVYVRYGDEELIAVRGLADYENEIPAQVDDLYRIGSVTKPFVATVMLQLVEEGTVGLDDKVADYLPDEIVERVENADTATIRHLLQMTSGIFNYTESDAFDEATFDDPSYAWTAAETVMFAYDEPAYFPAGEPDQYYYSNTNYNLAQMIIEVVTDRSLAEELEERIFAPLDMPSCYLETPDKFAQNIVRGYSYYDDEPEDITEVNDGIGLGDGGIVCNAVDLAKFLPGLTDLLEETSLNEMFQLTYDGEGGFYGLGIGSMETDYGTVIGHDGATSGFQSTTAYVPDEDLVIVVLTNNFDSDLVESLASDIRYELLGDE